MAASMTRWRRACWARVSGRVSVCSIASSYRPATWAFGEPAATLGDHVSGAAWHGSRHRQPELRARGDDRWPPGGRTRPPDQAAPARRDGRPALDDVVALGQGHGYRTTGPH